ncbi:hypothetical protein [Kitasatospora sp. HPMI-4]|uniref:hypothetical protein n=1 Tax=Kitasatospora sp. HPMI-4 TaxID=3448443 RepID=UPI003F1D1034
MTINGEDRDTTRGQVLLLAAAPVGSRRRLLDPEAAVGEFAAIPAQTLMPGWHQPVEVVPLVNPSGPQAVLARIRAAAAVPGPLLLYLCGLLVRDDRQHQVHLALADTTDTTIRYTALPWAWLARELAARRPDTTAVVLDLLADNGCLPLQPADLALPPRIARFGVVGPPARRGPWQPPAYTAALSHLLRSTPDRQHLAQLHPLAAGHAGLPPGSIVIGPRPDRSEGTVDGPRPHPATPAPATATTAPPAPPAPPIPSPAPPSAPPSAPPPTSSAAEPSASPAAEPAAEPVAEPVADSAADPRPAIAEAIRGGDHRTAADLTARWERAIVQTAGPKSPAMGDVLEVQATLAVAAGAVAQATERWLACAEHRLTWTGPGTSQVQLAVRNALHCWQRTTDEEPSLPETGRRLAELLRTTGRPRAAAAAEDRLADLNGPAYTPPTAWSR